MKTAAVLGTIAIALFAATASRPEAEATPPTETPSSTHAVSNARQSRIDLAMSAAPAAIAQHATIVEIRAEGEPTELRPGTNGWLCWPDDPSTPTPDPACGDEIWQAFFQAYMSGTEPKVDRLGISYMLRGSKSASNTDPFATEPATGRAWLEDGPHLMLLVPDPHALEGLPVQHSTHGEPYVMFSGTPYAHVMVPLGVR